MNWQFHSIGKWTLLLAGAFPVLSQAAWMHFDPTDTAKVPKKFSQTGFYSNWQAKTVTPEAAAFDVNTPLWSDNAAKHRWILLKNSTDRVQFNPAEDYYGYPDGAVFVKLFQHDTIPGNPASRIYWETRVLVNKKGVDSANSMRAYDYWYAFSYKWKADGSEAYLVSEFGFDTSMTIQVGGQKTFRKWAFPSVGACNQCHRQYEKNNDAFQGRAVLGFYTPQLNRPSLANPSLNQIAELFQKNILAGSQAAPTELEIAKMPKWGRVDDETVPLDTRARAYIAANCSGCHGERGLSTNATPHVAELNYDFFKKSGDSLTPSMELRGVSVGVFDLVPVAINGDTVNPALIVPGHPELSVLLYRMKHRNRLAPEEDDAFRTITEQMPPVGVFEEDTIATKMISRWISGLTPASIRRGQARITAAIPTLHGNILTIQVAPTDKVYLTGVDGRKFAPSRISEGRYQLPSGLPRGLYILQAGSRSYRFVF